MPDPTTIPAIASAQEVKPDPAPVPKTDWNTYVKATNSIGGDPSNPAYLKGHLKDNPESKLKEEHIPTAIEEIKALKEGKPIGKMTPEQAKYVNDGLGTNYKNNPKNLNYPTSPVHGTDLEKHLEANKDNIQPITGGGKIPAPNYSDPNSRLQYAQQFTKKYGALMQGRGDTPLRINEKPENATDTAKNITTKAAKPLGIDPTLLYTSAMEEGMSGLFPNKNGEVDDSGDKDYPTQGSASFGMDHFISDYPKLVAKGYLPASFKDRFKAAPSPDKNETQDSANYKTPDDALQAKAAILKMNYDQVADIAKKNSVQLSPKAKDFFALVAYNAGSGNAKKMLEDYQKAGVLKNDDFINKRPTSGTGLKESSWKQVHENVSRRILMANALKSEGLF